MILIAAHIQNFRISSFRGIRELELTDLGDINIIVGDNNAGKTSVLEALQIFCEPTVTNIISLSRKRERGAGLMRMGLDMLSSLIYLFAINDQSRYQMELSGKILSKECKVFLSGELEKQIFDTSSLPTFVQHSREENYEEEIETFVGILRTECGEDIYHQDVEVNKYSRFRRLSNSDMGWFLRNDILFSGDHLINDSFNRITKEVTYREKVIELLKEGFDESISDLRVIINDETKRYVQMVEKENGEQIPLSLYGDGMRKTLTMVNSIMIARDGVAMFDEFETGLHTSSMDLVFKMVLKAARELNVQLFMTTHSLEAVDKMLKSAGTDINRVKVIRLRKKRGKIYSKVMNGEEAREDREEYNMELRK